MVTEKVKETTRNVLAKTIIDDKILAGARAVKREVRKHIITAITAAFAFLIGLSWRDAIESWITILIERFHLSEGWYKFIAALVVTMIGVIGIIIVSKFEEKPIDIEEKKIN